MNENQKNSEFYDLATKKLVGEISSDEQNQFEELIKSEENQKIYADLEKIWSNSSPSISVDASAAWEKLNHRIEKEEISVISIALSPYYRWMSVAAAIVIALGIFTLYKFQTPKQVEFLASETTQIQLADNSLIDVKEGSKITYPESFNGNTREVNLSGEAFFDIERNEEKPFIIHTASVDVRVLGTSFFVKTFENGDTEVKVKTGKVEVSNPNDSSKVILTAGENILFEKINTSFKQIKVEANKLYWQTKTLIFNRTTLNNVVEMLNHNFDKNVKVANDSLNNCKLTVTFKNQPFNEILDVVKETLNLTVKEENGEIILDGEGCK